MSYEPEMYIPQWHIVLDGGEWVSARPHQVEAVESFVLTNNSRQRTPHPHGGMFEADFAYDNNGQIQYRTVDGKVVRMMMITPVDARIHNRFWMFGVSRKSQRKSRKSQRKSQRKLKKSPRR